MAFGEIANLYARIGADISGLKRGLNEAKGELNKTAGEFGVFGSRSMSILTNLGVAFGVVTTATFAFREAMEFANEAAQLQLLEKRFNSLAEEIGTTGEVLKLNLRVQAQGFVSDAKIMESAASFLSLKLVENAKDAARLARVASLLNMNMNQLVLTLTNKTMMRFDQLGVSVGGFEDRLKDLEKQGYDTNRAFTEAFLQQAENQIERIGDLSGTLAGELTRLTSAWENYTNSVKQDTGGLQGLLQWFNDFNEAERLMFELRDRGAISNAQFFADHSKLLISFQSATPLLEKYNALFTEYVDLLTRASERSKLVNVGGQWMREAEPQPAPTIGQDFSAQELGFAGKLGGELESQRMKMQELSLEAATLRAQIAQLTTLPYLSPEQQAQLVELRTQLSETTKQITLQALEHRRATQQILIDLTLQRIGQLEATEAITYETANMARTMVYDTAQAWGLMDEATVRAVTHIDSVIGKLARGELVNVQKEIMTVQNMLNSIQGDYYINLVLRTTYEENPEIRFMQGSNPYGAPIAPPISIPPLGGGGGGGGGSSLDPIKTEVKKLDPGRLALQMAQAVSQIGSMAAGIIQQQVIDPMQEQIEAIDKLIGPGFIDITAINRTAELEEKRAAAAEKVAMAQEKILALEKEQQRLQFLESQVRLLDLIAENKLDAKKILGGIDLGIGADPFKIVEATTRALQDLIAQSSAQLGLSVPNFDVGTALGSFSQTNIVLDIGDISSQLDIEEIARRVAEVLQYRNP